MAEGVRRGVAEGVRMGVAERGVEGCRQGAKGHREGGCSGCGGCRWGAWTFLSCWNFSVVAQMPCITSYRQCGAQSWRGVVQHIAARSRGTWECREGRRRVERYAAAMETGKAREHKKAAPQPSDYGAHAMRRRT